MKGVKYILDTDTCIYLIKKSSAKLLAKISNCYPGEIAISVITMSELYYGAHKSLYCEKNINALENFLLPIDILQFDDRAAITYGEIRCYLERKGITIGALDLMIAAHAKSSRLTLVTNNTKEFARVPELALENWSK